MKRTTAIIGLVLVLGAFMATPAKAQPSGSLELLELKLLEALEIVRAMKPGQPAPTPVEPPKPEPPPADPCAKWAPGGEMPNHILHSYCRQANPAPTTPQPPGPAVPGVDTSGWDMGWQSGAHFIKDVRAGEIYTFTIRVPAGATWYEFGWVSAPAAAPFNQTGAVHAWAIDPTGAKVADATGQSPFGKIQRVTLPAAGAHQVHVIPTCTCRLNFQMNGR